MLGLANHCACAEVKAKHNNFLFESLSYAKQVHRHLLGNCLCRWATLAVAWRSPANYVPVDSPLEKELKGFIGFGIRQNGLLSLTF
jgi:hypothetical protein